MRQSVDEKIRKKLRTFFWIMFGVYLILLCYFLFFAEITGRTYLGRTYHYNLVPFREIGRFLKYRETLGFTAVFLNLAGNVLVFVPYGVMLPLLAYRCRSFWYVTLLSFEFSLLVEVIQLVSKVGSFDVDDLLLNTIGGAIGYLCYLLTKAFWNRFLRGNKTDET